jgi:BRCT domain type II-containing protein
MTTLNLTAAEADAALKPFGIRVTTWSNSKTKLCLFRKDGSAETMLKIKVVELIKLRQQYG